MERPAGSIMALDMSRKNGELTRNAYSLALGIEGPKMKIRRPLVTKQTQETDMRVSMSRTRVTLARFFAIRKSQVGYTVMARTRMMLANAASDGKATTRIIQLKSAT